MTMSEAEHTPGPWEVAYLDQNGQRVVRQEHIEICTCWHHSVGSIEREMEANARLIAAAPDLLEAAMKVLDGLNARIDAADHSAVPVFDGIADLHDAISKATGAAP